MARRHAKAEQLSFAALGVELPRVEHPFTIGEQVTPEQVVRMAELDRAERNAFLSLPNSDPGLPPPYHFVASHVRQSKSAADLIRRAIEGRYAGLYCSGKKATRRMIYADEDRLRAAFDIASARNV